MIQLIIPLIIPLLIIRRFKDLGLTFKNNISFSKMINSQCLNAIISANLIIISLFINTSLIKAYFTFVRLLLEYVSPM